MESYIFSHGAQEAKASGSENLVPVWVAQFQVT